MKKKEKYILVMLVVGISLFPLLLNCILRHDALFPIVGDAVTWLSFWPTYLSAAASFGMIMLTYKSLRQTQEQMLRFEKQREEENRARIKASIIIHEKAYYLKLENNGKTDASKVRISVNQEFLDTLSDKDKRIFSGMETPFYIEVGRPVYFDVGWCKEVNEKYKGKDTVIILSGSYYSASVEYHFDEVLRLSEFVNKLHFVVRGDLETTMEHIKRHLIVQNDCHPAIQISLENIAKALETLVKLNEEIAESVYSDTSEGVKQTDNAGPLFTDNNWQVSYTYTMI